MRNNSQFNRTVKPEQDYFSNIKPNNFMEDNGQSGQNNNRSIVNKHRDNALSYKPAAPTKTPQYVSRKLQIGNKQQAAAPGASSKITNIRSPGYQINQSKLNNKRPNQSLVISSEKIAYWSQLSEAVSQ